jgi:membrane-bound metal-dependent hydrolase YbcI (DUF457 family)
MANFPTHIVVGTIVAGSLATLTLAADVIAPENLVAVTMAGSLGSVLPDIDLKDSRPSRALFAGLAVFFSFALLFHFASRLSIAEMWLLWLGSLLFVRYGLHTAFHRLTSHRGVWHSLIAGLACALVCVLIFYYVFGRPDGVAWLAGGFLLIGYLTHLLLDEIYSVDVLGNHIKKSFGTALKPVDMRNPGGSAAMAVAVVALLFLTPSITTFYDGLTSRHLWASLHQRLLPQEKWFGIIVEKGRLAGAPPTAEGVPQATGSLPSPPAAQEAPQPGAAP